MNIQSLSVCVPAGCPNRCKFCVSRLHHNNYKHDNYDHIDVDRLEFARDNGCNSVILTGTGEPLYNIEYIRRFLDINQSLPNRFKCVEIQTSGVHKQDPDIYKYLATNGVKTISLSLASLDWKTNFEILQTAPHLRIDDFIKRVCADILEAGLNLRLSLNINKEGYGGLYNVLTDNKHNIHGYLTAMFEYCHKLGAHQLVFRQLYNSNNNYNYEISEWINQNKIDICDIFKYIQSYGRKLEMLPYGKVRYSICGMSVVVDDDCMSTNPDVDAIRYLILRENNKLYTKWDDEGSLLF